MPSPAASKFTFRKMLRRFGRNRGGSAAVEFALVAPVFFALLFAIIESALMFFASQVLETATQNSARMVLTGQQQNGQLPLMSPCSSSDTTAQKFKCYVCSQIPALFDCSGIYVDVESYPSFSSVSIDDHIDAAGNFNASGMQFTPGGAGDIVVVRVFYQWPLFVTGLGYNIANLSGNKRLLVATAAFKNEPF